MRAMSDGRPFLICERGAESDDSPTDFPEARLDSVRRLQPHPEMNRGAVLEL